MENPEKRSIDSSIGTDDIEYVFAGTGTDTESAGKCDDECVGGSANTKAMEATVP